MGNNLGDDLGSKLNNILEEIFGAAESVKEKVYSQVERSLNINGEGADYYPAYNYPPMNVYITEQKSLVFEMALAGFDLQDIHLSFQGDFMYFNADWKRPPPPLVRTWLKKRMKAKSILEQKYFVPGNRFDHSQASATFVNGLLTITIPALAINQHRDEIVIKINEGTY